MMKTDLHLHTNCSDGSDTPSELVQKIIDSKIRVFALTDHDTVEGCYEISKLVPKGIKFIPSVELTCIAEGIKCHILGYNCDYNNKILQKLINKGKDLRRHKLETRIKYLKEVWNINMTKEELDWLYSRKSVVKTHIANILVNRGLADDNVSAMKKYLDGCKSGDTRFNIEEAIHAIKSAGGIPVWAHPLGGEGEEHISGTEFSQKLLKMINHGIEGLECYYSRYNMDEIKILTKSAQEKGLLITGGSDYHGTNKDIPIGKLNTENLLVEQVKLTLLSRI